MHSNNNSSQVSDKEKIMKLGEEYSYQFGILFPYLNGLERNIDISFVFNFFACVGVT